LVQHLESDTFRISERRRQGTSRTYLTKLSVDYETGSAEIKQQEMAPKADTLSVSDSPVAKRTAGFRRGDRSPVIRDVKASRPAWPRGQIIRPRPRSIRPRPRCIWTRPQKLASWPRNLQPIWIS